MTDKEEAIISLVLNETIEVLVPSAYSITFILAYYGPNASILGNIRNSYWTYEAVRDVGKLFTALCKMFILDLGSAIISSIFLWKCCRINLFQEYCNVMKKYWPVMTLKLAGIMYQVRII